VLFLELQRFVKLVATSAGTQGRSDGRVVVRIGTEIKRSSADCRVEAADSVVLER
jgi:hypothetical protein